MSSSHNLDSNLVPSANQTTEQDSRRVGERANSEQTQHKRKRHKSEPDRSERDKSQWDGRKRHKSEQDKFCLKVEVKHYLPSQLQARVHDKMVTVSGQQEQTTDFSSVRRNFSRSYSLPEEVEADDLVAYYQDSTVYISTHHTDSPALTHPSCRAPSPPPPPPPPSQADGVLSIQDMSASMEETNAGPV